MVRRTLTCIVLIPQPVVWSGSFNWKNSFNVDYPLVIDPKDALGSFALAKYFEEDAVPMAMMITTKDMRIRWKSYGYSAAYVDYQILKYVYND